MNHTKQSEPATSNRLSHTSTVLAREPRAATRRPGVVARLTIICAILLTVSGAMDRLYAATNEPEEDWEIRLGVPFWAPGLDGTFGVGDQRAHVDESDISDILDLTIGANLEMRKQRWVLFGHSIYLRTSADAEPGGVLIDDVELEQKQLVVDFGLGYDLVPSEPFSLELFAGGRVQSLDGEIAVFSPGGTTEFSRTKTWVDPIVGLIARWRLGERFTLFTEGDVGGFDVSSELTWQVNAGLEWDIARTLYLRASYRHLETDFEDDGFTFDMQQGGPQLEIGLRF